LLIFFHGYFFLSVRRIIVDRDVHEKYNINENGFLYHLMGDAAMKLDQVKRGDLVKILSISDPRIKEQALRMGIDEGSVLTCSEVIPAGPVVLGKHRQELAIGRALARNICVEVLTRAGEVRAVSAPLKSEPC
jgi:Fe2+ transport system protein FeoA